MLDHILTVENLLRKEESVKGEPIFILYVSQKAFNMASLVQQLESLEVPMDVQIGIYALNG